MADRVTLEIEARLKDEATAALRAIGIEAVATGKKGEEGFKSWSDQTFKAIVALNQGLELLGRIRRAAGVVASAMLTPIRLAAEAEQQEVKLAATLRATQNAAGLSARALLDMADAQEKLTAVDAEAIVAAQSVLLTFKSIGQDVFPRAMKASLDMSAVLGTELQGSVIQLGKALNDPILGVTALNRVGIQFTETQREMIKELVQTGNLLEAQGIILAEVEGQMGGVSELMGGTFLSSVQKVGIAWDDVLEAAGAFVVNSPVVKGALRVLTDLFAKWREQLTGSGEGITEFREDFDAFVRRAIPASVRGLSALVGGFFDLSIGVVRLGSHIKELREDFGSFLPNAAAGFVTLEKNLGIISEGEWATRMQEIGGFFDYWGPAAASSTEKIIKGLEGSKKASQDLLETAAKGLETITGEGSLLDQLIAEEDAKETMRAVLTTLRGFAGQMADIGFEFMRPFSVDPAMAAQAQRQQVEFLGRLMEIRKTDLERQEDEIRTHYTGMIAAQHEALQRQSITEEQFAQLRVAIEEQMNADIEALRAGDREAAAREAKAVLDFVAKVETDKRKALQEAIRTTRGLRQDALQNDLDAEQERFDSVRQTWLREASTAEEHALILEVLTEEHLARVRAIHEEHGEKMRAEAERESQQQDAEVDRAKQRARDQMEFLRDLRARAAVFEAEGTTRRLAELERSYEAEREAVMNRAALLELDAASVQQYLDALQIEHSRAVLAITGSTTQGIQEAFRALHDSRETEFEAARNDATAIIRSSQATLGDFLLSLSDSATTVEEKFRKMVGTILNEMAKVAAQRAAAQIFTAFGFADGGVMPGRMIPGSGLELRSFASGGVATRPTAAVFAEVPGMAEAFVPLPDGQRIPVALDMRGDGAGGKKGTAPTTYNLTMNWQVHATDADGFDRLLERRKPAIVAMFIEALNTAPSARGAVRSAVSGPGY